MMLYLSRPDRSFPAPRGLTRLGGCLAALCLTAWVIPAYAQSPQPGMQQLQNILELERRNRPHVAIPVERVIAAFRTAGLEISHVQQAPAVATGGDYALSAWVRQGTLGVSVAVYEFSNVAKLERFRQTMELMRSMNRGRGIDVGDYAINHTTALQVMRVSRDKQGGLQLRRLLLDIFRHLRP